MQRILADHLGSNQPHLVGIHPRGSAAGDAFVGADFEEAGARFLRGCGYGFPLGIASGPVLNPTQIRNFHELGHGAAGDIFKSCG